MTTMRVLFLCTGNSCRSQMAEGWLRHLGGEEYTALSAGTHPVGVNPRSVVSMAEVGVDISTHTSDSISDYLEDPPDVVITVCNRASETCPRFSVKTKVVAWSFVDPAAATGSEAEIMVAFAKIRDEIKLAVEGWMEERNPKKSL